MLPPLIGPVYGIEASTTYQAILEEGEARAEMRGQTMQARRILLLLGIRRFGEPDSPTKTNIDSMELEELYLMLDNVLEVASWQELLS